MLIYRPVAWAFFGMASLLITWALRDMLLPFVAGLALAYLLAPATARLESFGVRRWLATSVVLSGTCLVALVLMLLLVPVIGSQVVMLVAQMPGYANAAREALIPLLERLQATLTPDQIAEIQASAGDAIKSALGWTGDLIGGIWKSGMALVNVGSLLVITPIVAFYLLRDWRDLMATLDGLLPRPHRATLLGITRNIDTTLAGFVRGQASVCALLAIYYGVSLSATGLQFGLVVGMMAGLLSFIPYVGAMVGLLLSVVLGLLQFHDMGIVLIILGIFAVGQAIEGNVLTPKLVGEQIGLHPVWVMFALLAGASLFGFLGVLIAVPVSACIGVLIRFGVERYQASSLFTADDAPSATDRKSVV